MSREFVPVGVQIRDLDFSYPEKPESGVLSGISIDIMPGQMVAFIGPSGAGKTTLASLVLGLLQPVSGTVLINGVPPRDFVAQHPGKVSLVEQTTSLISGTIAQNIALGFEAAEIDQEQLQMAIDGAELASWVGGLEDGLSTMVDTGSMSGGQLQRIGLARALYTRPSLLVLDEPTSSLDADTESKISASLSALHGKVTQIAIAHRLTTIEHADMVYLIEHGKVSASGSFAELRRTSPTVARQVEMLTFKN
jgi:ABC-type multidrug transport system fused ATPase/permease subunit